MRLIAGEVGSETLSEIRRQKEAWQKQATVDLHDGRTDRALEAYRSRGFVHEHETQKEALDSMVEAWDKHRQEHPRESQLMLAYKRVDVFELNLRAREIRRSGGELKGRDFKVETERGDRDFAAGDRVCFLKNDRTLDVKNGTLGTIEIMEKGQAVIRLDGPGHRRVAVDFKSYNHLDHGYAATVHKSQGATVDRAHVLASQLFDRHTAYVGMTRHTGQADLHWSREEFSGQKDLYDTLSCERKKDMVVDYEKAENDNRKLAVDIQKGGGFERSAGAVEREARNIEKDWNAKKPASLKELAEELDGMSNKVDPSLSAIEKEFGTIENVDELDRVLEKAKGRDLDKDRGLSRRQDLVRDKGPEKERGKDQVKDKGIGRDLSHERGGRGGFEFDL